MKIRYQNGTAIEGVTLSRTEQIMRVAARGGDDVMELTNIHGTWVSDDCEPVTVEIGMSFEPLQEYSEDNFICSQQLASQLVRMLFSDSAEDFLDERSLVKNHCSTASPMIA